MKIFLTGFDPFDGETTNPSAEAIQQLESPFADIELVHTVLPTVFRSSLACLQDALEREQPDMTICVGQAKGACLQIERVAINVMDTDKPDNDEQQPVDEPIFADGPAAYFTNLPIQAMVAEIRKRDIPAVVSNSAGTYVCNQVMYGLMHLIATRYPRMKGGFIHVPLLHAQALDKKPIPPSMALSTIIEGLQAAILAAASALRQDKND